MAEEWDGRDALSDSSSPQAASPLKFNSWNDHRPEGDGDPGRSGSELPASRFYEELFCSRQSSAPLAGALATAAGAQSDVVRQGYLGKTERSHRRYFVLRAGSHTGPSRLEWHKSWEKFAASERSAGKAALFGSSKQGVIYLRCCLGVSRVGGSRKGHAVALYTKDQTLALAVEDQREQDDWYTSIKKLMEEEQKDEEHGEGFDEEDDGYCTLPPAAYFKEVWPVAVKPRGLGHSKAIGGESRLCLTASSLILIRVGAAANDLPSVTIPLLSVRRFGHLDGSFFLELGRSAPNGPGEIWMEARDQGNTAVAQHIHEMVRETVRALRALPDFSRSPTANHTNHNQLQTLLASKRCRPKCRDKLANVRPLSPPLPLPPRSSDVQTSPPCCNSDSQKPDKPELRPTPHFSSDLSPQRPEAGSYVDMRMDHQSTVATAWEPREQEGLGYVMMSPQVRHSPPALPQDDYVTMASPHKPGWADSSSSLQTLFSSSTSDGYSPLLHASPHRTGGQSERESSQSQRSSSCCSHPAGDSGHTQNLVPGRQLPPQGRDAASPAVGGDGSGLMTLVITGGRSCTRPVRTDLDSSQPQAARNQSPARRYRLLCLPSCLQSNGP